MDYNVNKLKGFILEYLIKKGKFGGAHTPIDNVLHNMPSRLLHNKKSMKAVDVAIKELANIGWVIVMKKRTGKGAGLHMAINPRHIKDIYAFLGLSNI